MVKPLLDTSHPHTFFDYYRLNLPANMIAEHFGYRYLRDWLAFADVDANGVDVERVERLQRQIEHTLEHVSVINEPARREFLIAPVLVEMIDYTEARIWIEYPLVANEQLQGTLDYFLESKNQLFVIEAKNADLQRGFNQLTAQLIALDLVTPPSQSDLIYGAVSIGEIWQFGVLERSSRTIRQDFKFYGVPADLKPLLQVLIVILTA
jgi:hypothetical protein